MTLRIASITCGVGALAFGAMSLAAALSGGPRWIAGAFIALWLGWMAVLFYFLRASRTGIAIRRWIVTSKISAMVSILSWLVIGEGILLGLVALFLRFAPTALFYAINLGVFGLCLGALAEKPR